MNVLFVCTGNVARSPAAATIFEALVGGRGAHGARSAGIAPAARRRLTTRALAWADVVAVMEPAHREAIARHWPDQLAKVRVLDVPDDYEPGESALEVLLTERVRALVAALGLAPRPAGR